MSALCDMGYFVSLETSGSKDCRPVDPRVKLILDVKTPSSGAADTFYRENLSLRQPGIEYKFVICNESDFEWSEMFCIENQLNSFAEILFSPSFGQVTEKWLAEKILKNGSLARLHLQQHKYIWTPETRGV
jgi:7-carboxy-7-deazaguanine synthase